MDGKRPALLVVALDAALRQAAFAMLSAAGFRVDAVADTRSGLRRAECDDYGLVVVESAGPFEGLEVGLPRLPLSSETLPGLVAAVESTLGLDPLEEADSAEPDSNSA